MRGIRSSSRGRWLAVGIGATMAVAGLTACSGGDAEDGAEGGEGGGSGSEAGCTNTIQNQDAEQVTVWAWYPAFEEVVDLFNSTHDDIQVCWSNAGQGNDEYTKFSTALEAGSGAPDVVMLETEVRPSFITAAESVVDSHSASSSAPPPSRSTRRSRPRASSSAAVGSRSWHSRSAATAPCS